MRLNCERDFEFANKVPFRRCSRVAVASKYKGLQFCCLKVPSFDSFLGCHSVGQKGRNSARIKREALSRSSKKPEQVIVRVVVAGERPIAHEVELQTEDQSATSKPQEEKEGVKKKKNLMRGRLSKLKR